MKTTKQTAVDSRLNGRLIAYAAAGMAAAAPMAASTSHATVVTSGPLNIAVPSTIQGIYLNLVTGATGTSATAVPGYDFNPYASGSNLSFYFSGTATTGDAGLLNAAGNFADLTLGGVVGPGGIYSTSITATTMALFRAGDSNAYLGLHFTNETTGVLDYGYIHLKTTGPAGFPATILDYAYDNTGAAITVNAVPEPTTTAALGLGALSLGAAGVRRWRRSQQAAA